MARELIRSVAARQIAQAVRAAFPGAVVETNRAAPVAFLVLPVLLVNESEHSSTPGPELGFVTLACQVVISWFGVAEGETNRTGAAHAAHAALAHAVTGGCLFLPDGQPFWPIESDFTLDLTGGEESSERIVGFRATYGFELVAPIGALTVSF
jgi:hypothetical protein